MARVGLKEAAGLKQGAVAGATGPVEKKKQIRVAKSGRKKNQLTVRVDGAGPG